MHMHKTQHTHIHMYISVYVWSGDGKAAENIIHPITASSLFSRAPFNDAQNQLPRQLLMVGSVLLEDRSDSKMVLWPATLKSATCLEPGECMPKNITLGAPPSITV